MRSVLGRPLEEALSFLPAEAPKPRIIISAAPRRDGQTRQDGTLRVIACRKDTWIAARFFDQGPREKEEP